MKQLHLLFVYNTDAGLFASVTDLVHKIVSPQTYNCGLCKLTYGNLAMKHQWKNFLDTLPASKTFLHKNEFENQYDQPFQLPAVFYLEKGKPFLLLSASDIKVCTTLDELQNALLGKIKMIQNASG